MVDGFWCGVQKEVWTAPRMHLNKRERIVSQGCKYKRERCQVGKDCDYHSGEQFWVEKFSDRWFGINWRQICNLHVINWPILSKHPTRNANANMNLFYFLFVVITLCRAFAFRPTQQIATQPLSRAFAFRLPTQQIATQPLRASPLDDIFGNLFSPKPKKITIPTRPNRLISPDYRLGE